MLSALAGITIFDRQHNHILHDYVATQDDIVIFSATFYETSKSFPNNSIVILFNAVQVFHFKHIELLGVSYNASGAFNTSLKVQPVIASLPFYCKWTPFLAVGEVAEHLTSFELTTGLSGLELETRLPYSDYRPVVACFSPLFLNERWQLLILTAEVIIFRIFVEAIHNSIRNQAGAMTDCLLQYKARLVDDIIIPRLGDTYYMEFEKVFALYPQAAAVAYNMSQASIASSTSPSTYSPVSVLKSLRFKGETRWGKLVVKPDRADSVWIHESFGIRPGHYQVPLPVHLNSALHFRFWDFPRNQPIEIEDTSQLLNKSQSEIPLYDPLLSFSENQTEPLYRDIDLESIEKSFRKMTRRRATGSIFARLPEVSLYYPLIEQCYNRIFYTGEQHGTCKGPELCDLPKFPGLRCTNVKSEFQSFAYYSKIFIHKLVKAEFENTDSGCSL
ncbi:hypothetical protein WR25_15126 [Diploscapter pachys]|uniref:Glycosyltransferase family 92 protein n=1 Tax=Diploscapter pachys TaxID=2018661 RepID=A0A2A2LMA2_9BILA|nr:hypothetical protein WR25_15126 [Diploscapter pachys]